MSGLAHLKNKDGTFFDTLGNETKHVPMHVRHKSLTIHPHKMQWKINYIGLLKQLTSFSSHHKDSKKSILQYSKTIILTFSFLCKSIISNWNWWCLPKIHLHTSQQWMTNARHLLLTIWKISFLELKIKLENPLCSGVCFWWTEDFGRVPTTLFCSSTKTTYSEICTIKTFILKEKMLIFSNPSLHLTKNLEKPIIWFLI